MKITITILLMLSIVFATFGQRLDGYKYVYVPTLSYTDGSSDTWNISSVMLA